MTENTFVSYTLRISSIGESVAGRTSPLPLFENSQIRELNRDLLEDLRIIHQDV